MRVIRRDSKTVRIIVNLCLRVQSSQPCNLWLCGWLVGKRVADLCASQICLRGLAAVSAANTTATFLLPKEHRQQNAPASCEHSCWQLQCNHRILTPQKPSKMSTKAIQNVKLARTVEQKESRSKKQIHAAIFACWTVLKQTKDCLAI